jgi:ribosomal protein S18 acetylase RimI-like enzyme
MEKPMNVSVQLVPMTENEFSAYEGAEALEYAAENVLAGYWAEDEAIDRARRSHRLLLPQGACTVGHHFCHVVDPRGGERVGAIWWFEDREGSTPRAFVYHIQVEPTWRRMGYASAALTEVETQARALGMLAVGLHVFAHNPEAVRVYERLGFRTASLNMLKLLQP